MESLRDKPPSENEISLTPEGTRFAAWAGSFNEYEICISGRNCLGKPWVTISL